MKRYLIALLFAATTAQPFHATGAEKTSHAHRLSTPPQTVQSCSERVGPFATQQRAWNVWNQARAQGYSVSNGVFICYAPSRAYCFSVFYNC